MRCFFLVIMPDILIVLHLNDMGDDNMEGEKVSSTALIEQIFAMDAQQGTMTQQSLLSAERKEKKKLSYRLGSCGDYLLGSFHVSGRAYVAFGT